MKTCFWGHTYKWAAAVVEQWYRQKTLDDIPYGENTPFTKRFQTGTCTRCGQQKRREVE